MKKLLRFLKKLSCRKIKLSISFCKMLVFLTLDTIAVLHFVYILGRRQVVSQRLLVPSFRRFESYRPSIESAFLVEDLLQTKYLVLEEFWYYGTETVKCK